MFIANYKPVSEIEGLDSRKNDIRLKAFPRVRTDSEDLMGFPSLQLNVSQLIF